MASEGEETLAEELGRLYREYRDSEGSVKGEAWNLIADCVVENIDKIVRALKEIQND